MFKKIIEWVKNLFDREKKVNRVFSLEEYLDLVSQYTDSTILKEKKNANHFTGGECRIRCPNNKLVKFCIQMYFLNDQNERSLKSSERTILLENFDKKTQELLGEDEKVFEILNPAGDK